MQILINVATPEKPSTLPLTVEPDKLVSELVDELRERGLSKGWIPKFLVSKDASLFLATESDRGKLQPDKRLADYGISDGSTLYLKCSYFVSEN